VTIKSIERVHERPALSQGVVANTEPLPAHLVWLSGGQWAIWRWIGLRSAGFPIQQVLELGSPLCAAAADRYLEAQERVKQTQNKALYALRQAQRQQDDPERHLALRKVARQLKKGRVPESLTIEGGRQEIEAFEDALASLAQAEADFPPAFQAAIDHSARAIYAVAGEDVFRQALLWQNRRVLRTGVDVLLRKSPDTARRSSQRRQHEALIVSYLQRYCAKNDTIGFFGPVGWAWVADQGAAVSVQAGPALLAARRVYFEGWCIDTLAETLAQDEALHPWFVPRRLPQIDVEGNVLHLPLASLFRLPAAQAAVLRACDGERTAKEIAQDLVGNAVDGLKDEQEVYETLKLLRSRRRIAWTLEVPAEGLHPERSLRQRLERIEEDDRREEALKTLDELDAARDAVAGAAGDGERLDHALGELNMTFTRLTDAAATRRAGETYAARTLVYQDCRRDVAVTLGPEFIAPLDAPLALILSSARWFTFQASEIHRQAFQNIHAELVRTTGARTVNFASFWLMVYPLLFGDDVSLVEVLESMLQERWAAILSIPYQQRRVRYASEDLRPRVLEAFAAPHPGWQSARYHSPDVMVAAASAQAIQAGQYQCVMGEVHPGINTLRTALFVDQHPSPDVLLAATECDLPEPWVILVPTREDEGITSRLSNVLVSPKDWRLVPAHDACGVPRSQALPIGTLVIEDLDGALTVRTRDGRLRFDVIELLGDALTLRLLHHFDPIPLSKHTPRINFDQLVVCRETWRFTPDEATFAREKTEADRFINARRWMHTHELPRFVFVKTPAEEKPFYVDLASPISVEILAKAIRRVADSDASEPLITVTEMLPAPDETWLTDRQGGRYTCEFRIVALDKQQNSPSSKEVFS
jgi:hypothetical protein